MKVKKFSTYVQKQIDLMLKNFRDFVKIYINDIIFFSTFLNQYIKDLNKNFQHFLKYDVTLNSKKNFLNIYSLFYLIKQ